MKHYTVDYRIDLTFLAGRGKIVPLTINSLTKSCDYYKNFFPVYEANVTVPNKNMEFIRDNQNKVYVHLVITSRYHNVDNRQSVIGEKIVLNQVFIPFFEQGSFDDKIDDEDRNKQSGDPKLQSASFQLKFTMYSAKGIIANKVPVNAILSQEAGVDVGTAIMYILNQAKSQDNKLLFDQVIIDEISQKQSFFELIIPPNNIAMSLRELQIRYGIFDGGIQAFYDEPVLYILNKYTSNHDYMSGQHKTIFFHYYNKPFGVSKIEESLDNTIRYRVYGFPQKAEVSVYEAELLGNVSSYSNFTMAHNAIHFEDGECKIFNDPLVSMKNVSEKHVKTGDKYNIEYDELNNPLMMSAYLKTIGSHRLYSLPNMDMVDYSTFRPNVNIVLEFDASQSRDILEKGFFSLISAELTFSRVNIGDNLFSCKASNLLALQS